MVPFTDTKTHSSPSGDILFYEPFAGISGDMHLAALCDLGLGEDFFHRVIDQLNLPGLRLQFSRETRRGVAGLRVQVIGPGGEPAEDGEGHHHGHHGHHEHHGQHEHHGHHEPHRGLKEITALLEQSQLAPEVKALSLGMFQRLAGAEAKIHGKEAGEIHFHEVGALDSIADIVCAAAGIHALAPRRILTRPPELGRGFVHCAHGLFPVPAPATGELLLGCPVSLGGLEGECTTPTGAVILAANAEFITGPLSLRIVKTGYGLGTRDSEVPNVLRLHLAQEPDRPSGDAGGDRAEELILLSCNLDDMNPELYEYVMARLYQAGALEVFFTPVYMKKNRPATLLQVLCRPQGAAAVREIVFIETTTGGIREEEIRRYYLDRTEETLSTPHGPVRVKHFYYRGRRISSKPEYDDLRALAQKTGLSLKELYGELKLRGNAGA